MKTHYNYATQSIGGSDIASLILRGPMCLKKMDFGGDGEYRSYIVDEFCEIPESYGLQFSCTDWIKIYDDNGLSFTAKAKKINVFRRGDYGCIIQLISEK